MSRQVQAPFSRNDIVDSETFEVVIPLVSCIPDTMSHIYYTADETEALQAAAAWLPQTELEVPIGLNPPFGSAFDERRD